MHASLEWVLALLALPRGYLLWSPHQEVSQGPFPIGSYLGLEVALKIPLAERTSHSLMELVNKI